MINQSHAAPSPRNPADAAQTALPWIPLAPLPEGPLDILGDIHGELDALNAVLAHLGYSPGGVHPAGRRLVFVGDLIDRGPDSLGVVQRVADLFDRGLAFMVMGNHDLNAVAGKLKSDNAWLFGHAPIGPFERGVASEQERREVLAVLAAMPAALERPDLRVVHACWDDAALAALRSELGPAEQLAAHAARIKGRFEGQPKSIDSSLALQNENPVKLLTSGPEVKADEPYFAGGKVRHEARHRWWNEYAAGPVVVFGHYWRIPIPALREDDGLFEDRPLNAMMGAGRAICIDYSVGGRASARKNGFLNGPFAGRLAALRWPEMELVFDDGERQPVLMPDQIESKVGAP